MPPVPAAGVPARVAGAVRSEGDAGGQRAPALGQAAVGKPVVVTVKRARLPTVNVVVSALVIAGAWSTVSVKVWVASGRRRWGR